MRETMHEKRIRFLIIIFILLAVAAAFYWRHQQMITRKGAETAFPLAVVIHKSEGKLDHPLVAVYQYKDGEHLVAVYEIDVEEDYLFKTVAAAKLRKAPEALAADSGEKGVWMKFSGKWRYFNDSLKEKKRSDKRRRSGELVQFTAEENRDGTTIVIPGTGSRFQLNTREKVLAVHSLAFDKSLYLALTESQFFILQP